MKRLFFTAFLKRNIIFFLVVSLTFIFAPVLFKNNGLVEVDITAMEAGRLQLFWSSKTEPVSRKRSVSIPMQSGRNVYHIPLKDRGNAREIRLDIAPPAKNASPIAAPVIIHSLSVHRKMFTTNRTIGEDGSKKIYIRHHDPSQYVEGSGLHIAFQKPDGGIIFKINNEFSYRFLFIPLAFLLLLHVIFKGSLMKGKKDSLSCVILLNKQENITIRDISDYFREKGYTIHLTSFEDLKETLVLRFHLIVYDLAAFAMTVEDLSKKYDLDDTSLFYNRSGEISTKTLF